MGADGGRLVAGPIVRFHEIADQLRSRVHSLDRFALGIGFLSLGLGKKAADAVALIGAGLAWLWGWTAIVQWSLHEDVTAPYRADIYAEKLEKELMAEREKMQEFMQRVMDALPNVNVRLRTEK